MKSIAVLGSTGSIGQNTLEVARHLSDSLKVKALASHSNIDLLEKQIREFQPEIVAVYDEKKGGELKKRIPSLKIVTGMEGLCEVASYASIEFVVVAIVGIAALLPTLSAIEHGKTIGLANKEILVSAGPLVTQLAKEKGVKLLPIDSEHSAIFQCLEGHDVREVSRLLITASGGPFRSLSEKELAEVTVEKALCHPTWRMGPKITVDSSTLMNKALEVIEAHFLFDIAQEKINVVIHPQSIIHSMVEFIDGSILAEMSDPHMIYPIQYALTYPKRRSSLLKPFDFTRHRTLEFFPIDEQKFPAIRFAFEALRIGKSLPCFLNAANEMLVTRFLNLEISWQGILKKLEKLMNRHKATTMETPEAVLAIDHMAREEAQII